MHRRLGIYLVGVAVAQVVLYTAALVSGHRMLWLFYLDPRIGLFMLETVFRHQEVFPGVLSWASAAILGAVGIAFVRNPARVRIYLLAEAVLAIPTLLMFVVVIAANIGPAHGFSVSELLVPVPVFLVASAMPFALGYRSLKRLANRPLQPTSGAEAES